VKKITCIRWILIIFKLCYQVTINLNIAIPGESYSIKEFPTIYLTKETENTKLSKFYLVYHQNNKTVLPIQIDYTKDEISYYNIIIYVPYWIINNTTLNLSIFEKDSKLTGVLKSKNEKTLLYSFITASKKISISVNNSKESRSFGIE
jgi:hypothetical protein